MANALPTAGQRFTNGLFSENPTFRQILGICPTLAVTYSVASALTMAGAVTFVLICSAILISQIRHLLKPHLRILVFTLTIAVFVTIADRLVAAFLYDMSKQLGPYIPLIIVNCIIIARCEICFSKQGLVPAIGDALGQAGGHTLGLLAIASTREILGKGTWGGMSVLGDSWPAWGVLAAAPGAFLTLGLLLALVNHLTDKQAKPMWPFGALFNLLGRKRQVAPVREK